MRAGRRDGRAQPGRRGLCRQRRTHQEYLLTEAGADLLPVLNALALWGEKHTAAPGPGAHMQIMHTACGNTSTSADVCSHCGGLMQSSSTAWVRPWRSPELTELQPRQRA